MSIELFEHNQKAYDAALSLMDETGKAAIIHPTGTGKSFIGFKLAEQFPKARICWLSPSEYIFKTQLENLKAVANGCEPDNIFFVTYAKLMMSDQSFIEEINPDYIILDEFHRCGAAEWGKGVKRLFGIYPDVPILGFSATNIRYLDNQRDMADELFEGDVASELTLGEAIAKNILLPPTYITSVYSYQKDLERYQAKVKKAKSRVVRDAAQKYLDELRRTLERAEGLDVIFDKHIKDRNGKFIVFCANIDHMNEMTDKVPQWFGKVDKAPHIYSVYADSLESEREFAAFKKDDSEHLKLLFCIDMLNEGVHAPDISGVILLRPTISPIIYKQQIGRALSASKGKQPVIFDIVRNFENLYSIDSVCDEMKEAITFYETVGESEKIINANFEIIDEVKDAKRLFNELQDSLSASWEMMFEFAGRYKKEFGNLAVCKKYKTEEGYSLGSWIETQRRIKKGIVPGVMTDERIEKLNSVGMIWDSYSDFAFEQGYGYARKYQQEHNNLDVSAVYVTPEGFALGQWICNLRSGYKGSGRLALTEERIKLLDEIGMIWDKNAHTWEIGFSKAKEYFDTHGNLDVPVAYEVDGVALGKWIRRHRIDKNTGKSQIKITPLRREKLDQIGMIWTLEDPWDVRYDLLLKYHKKHKNIDISQDYIAENNIWLGKWLHIQKRIYNGKEKGQTLTPKQIEKLDALGINWNRKKHKIINNAELSVNYGNYR